MPKTETVTPETALTEDLMRLRGFLEKSDIEGARAFIKELEHRWPDSDRVRHYVKVLAPPVAYVVPGQRIRSLAPERAWLREHAHEYPGHWLAIFGDKLIAADPDGKVVLDTVRQTPGAEEALLYFQPGMCQRH